MKILVVFLLLLAQTADAGQSCFQTGRDFGHMICVGTPDPDILPRPKPIVPQVPSLTSLMPKIPEPPIDLHKGPFGGLPTGVQNPRVTPEILNQPDLIRRTFPRWNFEGERGAVKTFSEITAWQNKLFEGLDRLNDTFFNSLSERVKAFDMSFEDIAKMEVPTKNALSLEVPEIQSATDLKGAMSKQIGRPLNNDNPMDNKMIEQAMNSILIAESSILTAYANDQQNLTNNIAAKNARSSAARLDSRAAPGEGPLVNPELSRETADDLGKPFGEIRAEVLRPPVSQDLRKLHSKLLVAIVPHTESVRHARAIGLNAIYEADKAYQEGDLESAKMYKDIAVAVADIALGFVPVVGVGRDAYVFFVGKNLLTGDDLGWTERGFAAVGLLTAGVVTSLTRGARAAVRLGAHAGEVAHAVKSGERIGEKITKSAAKFTNEAEKAKHLSDIGDSIRKSHPEMVIEEFHTAEELNDMAMKGAASERPFNSHSYGVSGKLKEATTFVRFYNEETTLKAGTWLALAKDIDYKRMTPAQIKHALSLPFEPRFVVEVEIPKGTAILKSKTSATYSGLGGTTQYRILEQEFKHFFKGATGVKL